MYTFQVQVFEREQYPSRRCPCQPVFAKSVQHVLVTFCVFQVLLRSSCYPCDRANGTFVDIRHRNICKVSSVRACRHWRQDPWGRVYPVLKSVLRDDYDLHIDDGLAGIQRICEQLGIFRGSVVLANRAPVQELSPKDHNAQLLQSTFPKEAFTAVRFPAGTVLWWDDPVISHHKAKIVSDPSSMSNEVLFREGAYESWYVSGRCRFWMRIF